MYDIFLNFVESDFRTPEMQADYLSFKRSHANVPLQVIIFICTAVYFWTRVFGFNVHLSAVAMTPTALLAISIALMMSLCFSVSVVLRVASVAHEYNIRCLQRHQQAVSAFLTSRFGRVFDDCTVVCGALAAGLYLVSEVLANKACPPGTPVFRTPGCNPSTVSPEDMVAAVAAVVVLQCMARGVSRVGLCLGWVITLVRGVHTEHASALHSSIRTNVAHSFIFPAATPVRWLSIRVWRSPATISTF
jgi:hypothetical protein